MHGEATYHFFIVTRWDGGEASMLGDEHTELRWFSIEEACGLQNLALAGYRDLFRRLSLSDRQ
jgi:8-oxo-dGTP diphosphatase